jgi:hypothetical protein
LKRGLRGGKTAQPFFVDFQRANAKIELLLRAALAKRRRPRKEM